MSTWKNLCKRGFAVFLSLTLCLSLMNVSAFAAGAEDIGAEDSSTNEAQTDSDTQTNSDDFTESDEDENDETQTPEGEDEADESTEGENGETQTPEGEGDADQSTEGENGETQTPEGEGDASEPTEGENGETQAPAEGEEDASEPTEGENGETQAPAEGEEDADKPAEGENGETQAPVEGEEDAGKPAEGENGEPQDPAEEETSGALSDFLSKIEAIGSGELDMDGILSAIDDCLSSYEQLSEEEKAALADARDALLTYQGELTGVLPDPIAPQLPELPEVPQAPQYSDAVQAFLDAAAQLPEEVTEENVEEVGAALEALLPLYQSLSEEEQNLDVVVSAYIRVMAVYEQYTGVMAMLMDGAAAQIGDTAYDTLQEAVSAAQDGDVIVLLKPVAESIKVSKSVTFDLNGQSWTGSGKANLTVNGADDVTVTVKNGDMTAASGFDAGSTGSVIHAEKCDLVIENCTISGDAAKRLVQAASTSGKIHPAVTLTIKDSSFTGAAYAAVYAAVEGNIKERSMKVDISNTTFKDNTRGLHCSVNNSIPKPPFDVDVTGCTFEGSGNLGAGISVANNANNVANFTLDVVNSNFLNGAGSAVKMASFSDCATVSITGGEISGNTVSYSSDSVIKVNGPFTMDGTKVTGNTGYLVMDLQKTDAVAIRNAVVSDNTSTCSSDKRGAIYVAANANAAVEISSTTFTGNTGRFGGALHVSGSGVISTIDGSTFKGNTASSSGGAIYLSTTGGNATINNTVITDNTANGKPSKVMCYGNYGGGLYVNNTTGTVTLSGTTRVYNNHTPNDTQVSGTNDGGSADIALYSTKVGSSSTAKNPANFSHATLELDCDTSFTGENGNKYTLTQFDRTLVNKNGYYWSSGSNYYWPMGYYTVVKEPARVYLNGQHEGDEEKIVLATTLEAAVEAAKSNGNKVYVCSTVAVTSADEAYLNSGVTFARCEEHPNGAMFAIRGDVTLDSAHIDGRSLESNSALISVSGGAHLTVAGSTVIENGKNLKGNGGGISLSQSSLTMTGGKITGNFAKQGGGIYAWSNYNGSGLTFEGGEVTRNTASSYGGGALIGYAPSNFGVHGGRTVFDSNTGYMGGGVYFVSDEHHVYRADFTNNTATRPVGSYYDGGGVYIETGTVVYMKNVFISGNKTKGTNPNAALGICPTGGLAILDTESMLVINNSGNDIGMDKAYTPMGPYINFTDKDATLIVSKNAMGGGQVSYGARGTLSFSSYEPLTDEQYANGFKGTVALKATASAQTIAWARALAESDGVVVTGNYAEQYGSGIMTNGALIVGSDFTDMDVEKKFVNADLDEVYPDGKPEQVIVTLVRMNADGTFVPVDPETRSDAVVVLNKANNWSYKWENLDALAEWGVAEASMLGWKLWNLESTDFTPPNAGESMTFENAFEMGTTFDGDVSMLKSNAYGRFLTSWVSEADRSYVTFVTKNDLVLTGISEGETEPITESDYLYYKWQRTDDGQMRCVAVSENLLELVPVLSAEEIEAAYGTPIKFLFDENGNPSGYVTKVDDTYYWWGSAGDGQFKCVRIVRDPSGILTNMESEDMHAVSFTKKAEGFAEDKTFQFKVTVTINTRVIGNDGTDFTENTYPTYSINGGMEIPLGDGSHTGLGEYTETISIKADETVTITGLQEGDTYKIEELGDDSFFTYIDEEESRVVEGTVAENDPETIEFCYKNINKASLKIIKVLAGGAAAQGENKEFVFTVTGPDGYEKRVTITGEGEAILENLKPGEYTVTEADAKIPGFIWNVSGKNLTVKVEAGKPAEVTFTNTYEPEPTTETGSLTITKVVSGGGSAAANKVYTFVVTGPNGYSAKVHITGAGSYTLKGLLPGEYTVTEDRAGAVIGGYTLTISGSGSSATVVAGGSADVTITNTYTTPGDPGDPEDPEDPEDPPAPPPTPEIPDEEVPLTDIPEEEVPLAEIPEEPEELEIPEEEVPLAEVPETGDLSGNWMMAMLMGALGMIWMALTGKKRSEEEG